MAELTVQDIDHTGLDANMENAAAGGDTFANDGTQRTFLKVKNDDASSKTVTIDSKEDCSYGFDHDPAVTVPAGEERLIGPFSQARFSDPVSVTYDAVTSLTVAALRLPKE